MATKKKDDRGVMTIRANKTKILRIGVASKVEGFKTTNAYVNHLLDEAINKNWGYLEHIEEKSS